MNKPKSRIPLESATKDEIIAAIRAELPFGEHIDRIQMHIYYDRCEGLIRTMSEATEQMARNRQSSPFNEAKRKRFNAAFRKWSKANASIQILQSNEA